MVECFKNAMEPEYNFEEDLSDNQFKDEFWSLGINSNFPTNHLRYLFNRAVQKTAIKICLFLSQFFSVKT